jgi:2-oxoglutarate ferredoxin oxidoreductase subunit beta
MRLSREEIVLISGIGCAGRISVYVDFATMHTTHGRALTFATGIKLVKPDLKVIVVMGDGDATAIGGNHLIHAARRNVNLTAIVVNNNIYGMTGGQYSPTTPYGLRATTAPHGHVEHDFNISRLVDAAGGSYVARGTVYHVHMLDSLIQKAISKEGFALVEVMSTCPTHFGKLNLRGTAVDLMRWMKDHAISVEKTEKMKPEELKGKYRIGVLADRDIPDFQAEYDQVRRRSKQDRAFRPSPKEISRLLESYFYY